MKRISIFASGGGSNGQKIYEYFKGKKGYCVDSLVCNNPGAGVLRKAKEWGCEVFLVEKESFKNSEDIALKLKERGTDLIVLAGFLWLVPSYLLKYFPDKIINIHPALLPKYGGKGMHGMNVHQAVHQAGEKESGITIHYINEEYDKGAPILQKSCGVEGLAPEQIAAEVLRLEHHYLPRVVEQLLKDE